MRPDTRIEIGSSVEWVCSKYDLDYVTSENFLKLIQTRL